MEPSSEQATPADNLTFLSYEARVRSFFSHPQAFSRLLRIFNLRDDGIFDAIVYFTKDHQKNKITRDQEGNFYCISDEYKNAITCHKKRFFDFSSRTGKGGPVHRGKVNPCLVLEQGGVNIMLPLPCLVAMWWFVQYHFDLVFWSDYSAIRASHESYTITNKRMYSQTHKTAKSEIRHAMIKKVMADRNPEKQKQSRSGKQPILTRPERHVVAKLVVQERKRIKEENRLRKSKAGKTVVKHRHQNTCPQLLEHVGEIAGENF